MTGAQLLPWNNRGLEALSVLAVFLIPLTYVNPDFITPNFLMLIMKLRNR
jgi:hypothetical protein